jgi:hypothetical protein
MERTVRKLGGREREELQESIDIARSEISRLDSIVTQFLRAIRPSKPQLHPENVNTIVEEAVRFFTPEIQDRDIVVEQELRSDLPLLELDRDQMKQAFYNIIKNSFEAMKRRGIMRIRTDMDGPYVLVSFTDTGGGMSAETLSRVFEPYFTTKQSGSGLGLLIVRRIVREHGGELGIESSEGKGITLTIRRCRISTSASACSRRATPPQATAQRCSAATSAQLNLVALRCAIALQHAHVVPYVCCRNQWCRTDAGFQRIGQTKSSRSSRRVDSCAGALDQVSAGPLGGGQLAT